MFLQEPWMISEGRLKVEGSMDSYTHCDGKQINYWREAFYHYLMAHEIEMDSEEMLEQKWHDFVADALLELSNILDRLKHETGGSNNG